MTVWDGQAASMQGAVGDRQTDFGVEGAGVPGRLSDYLSPDWQSPPMAA